LVALEQAVIADIAIMMMGKNAGVKIRVPASTSNLGPAFDAVGLAFQLYLIMEVRALANGPSRIEFSGEDAALIPTDESNYIWRSMMEIAEASGCRLPGFSLRVENQIPVAKGLGSSSAALLAAAAAVNFLCARNWDREKLLEITTAREGHPDNLAPSLFGGLVASICGEKIFCSKSEFPQEWTAVAVTPNLEISTEMARSILPAGISRKHAVYNIQRVAFLMAQLVQGRREGLREAMSDLLHQPYRSKLIPGLKEVLAIKQREGLLGIALSGAGSTVIAFADSQPAEIGAAICDIFRSFGLSSRVRLLQVDNSGLAVEPL
jgi:homoserine kinase